MYALGVFLKEFSLLKEIKGDLIISVLIEHSFRIRSVYFEVRSYAGQYSLYWEYEIPLKDCLPVIAKCAKPKASFTDALSDPNVIHEVLKLGKVYSCKILPDEMRLINEIALNGLPELDKKPSWGLDGHSYHINCPSIKKEYECWAVLPTGWDKLAELIFFLARKADLEISYLPAGMR